MDNFQKLFVRIRKGGDDAIVAAWGLSAIAVERLREERRWIPVAERLPDEGEPVLWHGPGDTFCRAVVGKVDGRSIDWGSDLNMDIAMNYTHWQPLTPPPEATP